MLSPRIRKAASEQSMHDFMFDENVPLCTTGILDQGRAKASMAEFSKENILDDDSLCVFSDFSDLDTICDLCQISIPAWSMIPKQEIKVHQILKSQTNQMFRVSVPSHLSCTPGSCLHDSVAFRIHGQSMTKFYDLKYENKVFDMLGQYQIGPQLLAQGKGWRIEEWYDCVTVPTSILSNLSICAQTASCLGRIHKLHRREDFVLPVSGNKTLERLKNWTQEAHQIAFENPGIQARLESLRVDEAVAHAEQLSERLSRVSSTISGQGYDIVFSHNNIQENHLMQTEYGLRIVDFEYAGFNFQAVDVANFFVEFMFDNLHPKYPFYQCSMNDFPCLETQKFFAAVYLSEYLEMPVKPSDRVLIEPFLDTVHEFVPVSHLLWGLWAVVRSGMPPTFQDFDFLGYAKLRLDMFRGSSCKIITSQEKCDEKSGGEHGFGGVCNARAVHFGVCLGLAVAVLITAIPRKSF